MGTTKMIYKSGQELSEVIQKGDILIAREVPYFNEGMFTVGKHYVVESRDGEIGVVGDDGEFDSLWGRNMTYFEHIPRPVAKTFQEWVREGNVRAGDAMQCAQTSYDGFTEGKHYPVRLADNGRGLGVENERGGYFVLTTSLFHHVPMENNTPVQRPSAEEEMDLLYAVEEINTKTVSDGGSTDYYKLPQHATELRHLISHKGMSKSRGDIFKACYRLGEKDGADVIYDLRKIAFFAQDLIEMYERGERI